MELAEKEALLFRLLTEETGESPIIWSGRIQGFGTYHYRYESGREGSWFLCGLAKGKDKITLYLPGADDSIREQLQREAGLKSGNSCFYLTRSSSWNEPVIRRAVRNSLDRLKQIYPDRSSR